MDYLEALSELNKKQKKDILNIIAQDRIDEYGAAGKVANLGDRAFSILGGSGNNIRLNPTEEEKFISLAMEALKPKRKGKANGGNILEDDNSRYGMLSGGQSKLDMNNREQYVIGGIVKAITKFAKQFKGGKGDIHTPEFKIYMREKLEKEFPKLSKKELDVIMKDLDKPMGTGFPFEEFSELSDIPKNMKVFKNEGGLLEREQYVIGGLAKILSKSVIKKLKNLKAKANTNSKDAIKFQDESINVYEQLIDEGLSADEATKALQDALDIKVGMNEGGLLDNREQYVIGGLASKIASKILKNTDAFAGRKGKITLNDAKNELKNAKEKVQELKNSPDRADELEFYEGIADELEVKIRMIEEDIADEYVARGMAAEGGPMSMDNQMMMVMSTPQNSEMESDDDMEDNYTKFIMEEALTEDEEDMLMSKLEQDEELAMIFDKVIDVAQEFAGSGPVEGPGSGVSDSIPARLSDGEFVFTAKAVEEIGADNLMAMMKDAEMKADERQGLVTGGPVTDVEEERVVLEPEKAPAQQINVTKETVDSPVIARDEEDIIGDDIKKSMLQKSWNI